MRSTVTCALLVACAAAGAATKPTAAPVVSPASPAIEAPVSLPTPPVQPVPHAVEVQGCRFVVPAGFTEEVSEEDADKVQQLVTEYVAYSDVPVGGSKMMLALDVAKLDKPTDAKTFPTYASVIAPGMFAVKDVPAEVMGRRMVDRQGKQMSLTALVAANGLGVMMEAVAQGDRGYMLICVGDVNAAGDQVTDTCAAVSKTLALK